MDTATRDVMMRTGINDAHATPMSLFMMLDSAFAFVLDVAASRSTARVPHVALDNGDLKSRYFGPDHDDPMRRDALVIPWSVDARLPAGAPPHDFGVCWMNPPYSDTENKCRPSCKKKRCLTRGYHLSEDRPGQREFIEKAYLEASLCRVPTIALLPARTDTEAFHEFVYDRQKQTWHRGVYVRLLKGRLTFEGETDPAPFPSMLVAFWPKLRAFPGWPALGVH